MNLSQILEDYLTTRRNLGYKLRPDGIALTSFVSFMALQGKDIITTALALSWAKLPETVQPARWARRLAFVRSFACYCKAMDPRTEIPPKGLLPIKYQRPNPYLFNDGDISQLLAATKQILPENVFVGQAFYCLFGLVSVTGLRINEALNLTMDDVDLETGVLTVRDGKFGKSRLLPLHKTTVSVLTEYRAQRAIFLTGHQSPYWFVNKLKEPLGYDCVRYHFDILMRSICPVTYTVNRKPHLHDLRHHFALSVLINWYQNGQDVERCLPILSTYLGHVDICDTYWYLSASPALMEAAKLRLEQHWEKPS